MSTHGVCRARHNEYTHTLSLEPQRDSRYYGRGMIVGVARDEGPDTQKRQNDVTECVLPCSHTSPKYGRFTRTATSQLTRCACDLVPVSAPVVVMRVLLLPLVHAHLFFNATGWVLGQHLQFEQIARERMYGRGRFTQNRFSGDQYAMHGLRLRRDK